MNIDYGISTIEINGTDVVMLTVGDGKTGFVDGCRRILECVSGLRNLYEKERSY